MKKPNKQSNSIADVKAQAKLKAEQEKKEALSKGLPDPGPGNTSPEHLAAINATSPQKPEKGKKEPKAAKPTEPEVPTVTLPFSVPAIESGYMEVRDLKGDHVLASIDLYRATNLERRNRRPLWIVSFNGSGAPSVLLDATKQTQRDGFALALQSLKFDREIVEAAIRQIKAHNTIREGATAKAKAE